MGVVLVLDPHRAFAEDVLRHFAPNYGCVVTSVAHARPMAEQVAGVIAEVVLPDGDGLAFAIDMRRRLGRRRVLALTGMVDAEVWNRAQRHDVRLLCKSSMGPCGGLADDVRDFAAWLGDSGSTDSRLARAAQRAAARHSAPRRVREAFVFRVLGYDRKTTASAMSVSVRTVDAHLEVLRVRAGKPVRELVEEVRDELLDDAGGAEDHGRGQGP